MAKVGHEVVGLDVNKKAVDTYLELILELIVQ